MKRPRIIRGDSLKILKTLEPNSVDAIVTDPPYGLSFMGKKWDYDVPTKALWSEVLRVLKPGGHLLSFGGTRTFHRLACAIEDAGFEIRDQIQWIYGSGFPKSHDVSKGIDKAAGAEREAIALNPNHRRLQETETMCGQPHVGTGALTAPATDAAKQWQGWGTALKPANEPIVLARKPLSEKTVAQNVLKWGTGALNIDGGRIGFSSNADKSKVLSPVDGIKGYEHHAGAMTGGIKRMDVGHAQGRFPANVLFDEAAAEMLDAQSGVSKDGVAVRRNGNAGKGSFPVKIKEGSPDSGFGGSGGASRFFYVAKASKRERNAGLEGMPERITGMSNGAQIHGVGYDKAQSIGLNKVTAKQNHHPTVKPIRLMEYLCRLITPPGGVILDPFMGSGSTGVACKNLGFEFIGIEKEKEYVEISRRRIKNNRDFEGAA